MWQATEGHADSDPKTLNLHVWRLPDVKNIPRHNARNCPLWNFLPLSFKVFALKALHVL